MAMIEEKIAIAEEAKKKAELEKQKAEEQLASIAKPILFCRVKNDFASAVIIDFYNGNASVIAVEICKTEF